MYENVRNSPFKIANNASKALILITELSSFTLIFFKYSFQRFVHLETKL